MKTDSTYQVSSAIPIHTTKGIKTGILDSGSGVTLIKNLWLKRSPVCLRFSQLQNWYNLATALLKQFWNQSICI